MPLVHQPKRGKEKPLKLSDAQKADIQIAILLGLGVRSNEEIGRKVGYSAGGVKNRRAGANSLVIAEIENTVKHELNVSRQRVENVAADQLREEIGKRAGKILANIDVGLEETDPRFRANYAQRVAKDFVLAPLRGGRGGQEGEGSVAPPTVYRVSIGAINIAHGYVKREPITVPDRAKAIDVGSAEPVSVSLPAAEERTMPR